MSNIISLDVGSEVTYVYATNTRGKLIFEGKVSTMVSALREAIKRVARPRQLVFEECSQAAWLYSELDWLCDDLLVCVPPRLKEQKSDRIDAQELNKRARLGLLNRVWHGGKDLQRLRQSVGAYLALTKTSTRLKNQIKGAFIARGMRNGSRAYNQVSRESVLKRMPTQNHRERVRRLGNVLDVVTQERAEALKSMITTARKNKLYSCVRTIDGLGPIFSSYAVAFIGDPHRFRTRRQFFSYCGLAVKTHETGEFIIDDGKIVRKRKTARTRGLVKQYNRVLKCLVKQVALTLSRTKWKSYHDSLLAHSKNENNVQLTIARKVAAILLHVAKSGEKYDVSKAFKQQ